MNFYIVMQGRTYEMEQANEMICSEIFNKKGETRRYKRFSRYGHYVLNMNPRIFT